MAAGAFAVDRVLGADPLPSGTSAFVAGQGFRYSSPDHTFDARFPQAPTVSRETIPVATSSATISLAQVQTDDYEVVAGSMVLPIPIPSTDIGNTLEKILEQAVAAQDAKVTSETQINRYGVPGAGGNRYLAGRVAKPEYRVGIGDGTHAHEGGHHRPSDRKTEDSVASASGPH